MYCGDETGSFIGEIGSHTSRFGYGGEDNPKLVLPSYVVRSTSTSFTPHGKRRMARISSMHPPSSNEQIVESILRMAKCDDGQECNNMMEDDVLSKLSPQTDPTSFWSQGDSVESWDNLQTAWETSMETLRATDTKKHTQGGNPYFTAASKRRQTSSSSGVTSSTVVGSTESSSSYDGKCVHPLLAITPGMTHYAGYGRDYCAAYKRQQYVQYTELLMESLDATSMFLAPAPMLAAFSLGRQTALMVDLGAGGCRVTPVVDGLVLRQSQRRNGRGGDWLGNATWQAFMNEFHSAPKPRYMLRGNPSPNTFSSSSSLSSSATTAQPIFYRRAMNDLMYEVRTEPFVKLHDRTSPDIIRVPFSSSSSSSSSSMALDSPATPESPSSANTAITTDDTYQLPDGTCIDLSSSFGRDLRQIPELLFSDTLPFLTAKNGDSKTSSSSSGCDKLTTLSHSPLHKLVHESILAVGDVDVRKELVGSICLVGGTSLFPNLDTRLSQELSHILPTFVKPKVVASRFSVERSCAAWIGGSILTSLGSFQQLWLSRAEYEEYGAAMAVQRFP